MYSNVQQSQRHDALTIFPILDILLMQMVRMLRNIPERLVMASSVERQSPGSNTVGQAAVFSLSMFTEHPLLYSSPSIRQSTLHIQAVYSRGVYNYVYLSCTQTASGFVNRIQYDRPSCINTDAIPIVAYTIVPSSETLVSITLSLISV